VDEAELAVVVARPDPVEDGRGDLGAEGLTRLLGDAEADGITVPATADDEVQIGLVDQKAVLDDVTRRPPVEEEELVPGPQPGQVCR
jgi:hypothetical protein